MPLSLHVWQENSLLISPHYSGIPPPSPKSQSCQRSQLKGCPEAPARCGTHSHSPIPWPEPRDTHQADLWSNLGNNLAFHTSSWGCCNKDVRVTHKDPQYQCNTHTSPKQMSPSHTHSGTIHVLQTLKCSKILTLLLKRHKLRMSSGFTKLLNIHLFMFLHNLRLHGGRIDM